jgi:hypothetical protein
VLRASRRERRLAAVYRWFGGIIRLAAIDGNFGVCLQNLEI